MAQAVVVVDKSTEDLLSLTIELQHHDVDVYSTGDIDECLALVEEYKPALVLLDSCYDEEKVKEVLAALRPYSEEGELSVLVTGENDDEKEETYLKYGVNDFIPKPYKSHLVKLRVETQLKVLNYLKQVKELSSKDALTGLSNRRDFESKSKLLWSNAVRQGEHVAVLAFDIDKFKSYNDNYGHHVGDAVLKETASVLKSCFKRETDVVCRWGGEEFVALLYGVDEDAAYSLAEYARASVESNEFEVDDICLKVTTSVGVYSKVPSKEDSVYDFVKRADEALYEAKQTGRNKVCAAE